MGLSFLTTLWKSSESKGHTGHGDYLPAPKARPAADPLEQMLRCGRLGLIVGRPGQWVNHARLQSVMDEAARLIDENYALVPAGIASIPLTIYDQPGQPEVNCDTRSFLLGRHAVTNAAFQLFVDDGGYANLELWPEEIWPLLVGFRDQGGEAGPRYWRSGRHDRRLADHPVVGISYYEAAAYAQWAGLRLPTEAEWQTAAGWQIRSIASAQRRYPWGDSFELERCNLWASGHGGTLSVTEYADGAAPNGVLQLIGNVWEWTNSDFLCADRDGRPVVGDMLMKSIRGGAFDTYFVGQATTNFRTGLGCTVRSHNVGFRCALDLVSQ